jgi:hypothetical protein
MNWPRQQYSFRRSVWRLLGHLTFGSLVFVVILAFAWVASFVFSYLNSLLPFPAEIATLFSMFEVGLFCLDIVVSTVVLLMGVAHFLQDVVLERDR